jgi:hypothetical protein
MSTLQVSNLHFESTGNNRLQYTGSNTYNLVGGGATVATINTTSISFPLSVGLSTITSNAITSNTIGVNILTANAITIANSSVVTNNEIYGKQTIWVPPNAFIDVASTATLFAYWPNFGFSALALDSTTVEGFTINVRMPKGWNEGALDINYVWAHPTTTTNFGVVMDFYAAGYGAGETLNNAAWTGFGIMADTGGTTNTLYVSDTITLTPEGTLGNEDLVTIYGARRPANSADTMTVDMYLLGVTIKYTINSAKDD